MSEEANERKEVNSTMECTNIPTSPLNGSKLNQFKAALFCVIFVGLAWNFLVARNAHVTATNLIPSKKASRPLDYALSLSQTKPHRPDLHLTHWGVITTIFNVNPAVKQFNRDFPSYGLVVVGDRKTKHELWQVYSDSHSNVVYLTPDDQLALGLKSALHIPWSHFGRKSLGYLYAIQHGAQYIFDFDDDNHLRSDSFEKLVLNQWELLNVKTEHHLYNPYPHFGPVTDSGCEDTTIWPRGFPMQFVHDVATRNVTLERASSDEKISIFQSLADHNPDVDAVYRMTREIPVTFKSNLNDVILPPQGTFVPWNSQAVIFKDTGFFGLLLPTTVEGRVSDIWRSYIVTRLLWETDNRVAFTSPIVTQYRNPHSLQQDLVDEADLYYRCDELLAYLASWTRREDVSSLSETFLALVAGLVSQGFLMKADEQLAQAWVSDLDGMGYVWPNVTQRHAAFVPPTPPIVDERMNRKSK